MSFRKDPLGTLAIWACVLAGFIVWPFWAARNWLRDRAWDGRFWLSGWMKEAIWRLEGRR